MHDKNSMSSVDKAVVTDNHETLADQLLFIDSPQSTIDEPLGISELRNRESLMEESKKADNNSHKFPRKTRKVVSERIDENANVNVVDTAGNPTKSHGKIRQNDYKRPKNEPLDNQPSPEQIYVNTNKNSHKSPPKIRKSTNVESADNPSKLSTKLRLQIAVERESQSSKFVRENFNIKACQSFVSSQEDARRCCCGDIREDHVKGGLVQKFIVGFILSLILVCSRFGCLFEKKHFLHICAL